MKVLLVEDEIHASERLKKLLVAIDPQIEVLAACDSVESSVKWIKSNPLPDLIFMDIEIADGRSFEIFKQVQIPSPVIFITSYNEFAINAIKLNALDYLLKPIDKNELKEAVLKAQKILGSGERPDYPTIYNAIGSGDKPKKLAVNDLNGARFVEIDKIVRLKADSNYTHIVLTSGESIVSSKTLKDYEEMLVFTVRTRLERCVHKRLRCDAERLTDLDEIKKAAVVASSKSKPTVLEIGISTQIPSLI